MTEVCFKNDLSTSAIKHLGSESVKFHKRKWITVFQYSFNHMYSFLIEFLSIRLSLTRKLALKSSPGRNYIKQFFASNNTLISCYGNSE